MKRHDTIDLWNFAARGLHAEDARFTEEHLLDCPDCQATLAQVQKAQSVLGDARLAQPKLPLARADAALAKEIARRLLKKARPVRWGLVAAPLAIAAALLVGLALRAWPLPQLEPVANPVALETALPPQTGIQVERAADTVRGSDGAGLQIGGQLASGDSVRTGGRGSALLQLPDTSRLRLASSSQLGLSSVSAQAVDLQLERGRVAVHAAHVRREAFTVRTADVTVHVLGTTFAVTRGPDFVEVAVSEGRVGVESPRGLPFFVSAGERVRVGTRSWRPVSRAISGALKDELREVAPQSPPVGAPAAAVGGGAPPPGRPATAAASGPVGASAAVVAVGPAPSPAPEAPLTVPLAVTPLDAQKVGAPVSPVTAVSAEVPADWQPMPNSRAPVGLRGVAEPNPPEQEVSVPAPATGSSASGVDPAPAAPAPPASARPVPAPPPTSPSVAPPAATAAATEVRGPMPEDLEELFLMRAERALRNGGCDRYLLGLADIAEDPQKTMRQERARIAMARCQQTLGQPEAAAQEFARYARDFPKGLFAREATAAAAAQPAVAK